MLSCHTVQCADDVQDVPVNTYRPGAFGFGGAYYSWANTGRERSRYTCGLGLDFDGVVEGQTGEDRGLVTKMTDFS